ncbi:hypothetical protein BaRGS_00034353 [Batillaria attramentaria]|uniref:Novel STAND NTPase 3 domain-containing protein n=1 Tax=Batillaria attramentaria TaxID=370345 RepID=A0ABD0JHL4_9CAEN
MAFSADFGDSVDVYIDDMSDVSGGDDFSAPRFSRDGRCERKLYSQPVTTHKYTPRSTAARRSESRPENSHSRKSTWGSPNFDNRPSQRTSDLDFPHYFDARLSRKERRGGGSHRDSQTSVPHRSDRSAVTGTLPVASSTRRSRQVGDTITVEVDRGVLQKQVVLDTGQRERTMQVQDTVREPTDSTMLHEHRMLQHVAQTDWRVPDQSCNHPSVLASWLCTDQIANLHGQHYQMGVSQLQQHGNGSGVSQLQQHGNGSGVSQLQQHGNGSGVSQLQQQGNGSGVSQLQQQGNGSGVSQLQQHGNGSGVSHINWTKSERKVTHESRLGVNPAEVQVAPVTGTACLQVAPVTGTACFDNDPNDPVEDWPSLDWVSPMLSRETPGSREGEGQNLLVDFGQPHLDSKEVWQKLVEFCESSGPCSLGTGGADPSLHSAATCTSDKKTVLPSVAQLVFQPSASGTFQHEIPLTGEVSSISCDVWPSALIMGDGMDTMENCNTNLSDCTHRPTPAVDSGINTSLSHSTHRPTPAVDSGINTSLSHSTHRPTPAVDSGINTSLSHSTHRPTPAATSACSLSDSNSGVSDTPDSTISNTTPDSTISNTTPDSTISSTTTLGSSTAHSFRPHSSTTDSTFTPASNSVSFTLASDTSVGDTPGSTTSDSDVIPVSDTSASDTPANDTTVSDSSTSTDSSMTPDRQADDTSVHVHVGSSPDSDITDPDGCAPGTDTAGQVTAEMRDLSLTDDTMNLDLAMPATPMSDLTTSSAPISDMLQYSLENCQSMLPAQDQTFMEMDAEKEMFVCTSNWEDALDMLQTRPESRIILSGPPGSGKQTIGRALLRHFEKTYACHVIKTAAEWRKLIGGGNTSLHQKQIVMCQHLFGRFHFEKTQFDEWEPLFQIMLEYCRSGKVGLVFTMYPHVLQFLRDTYPDNELFGSICEVRMRNLVKAEKKEMLESHLRRKEKEPASYRRVISHIMDMDSESGEVFPDCCQRWSKFVTERTNSNSYHDADDEALPWHTRMEIAEMFFQPVFVYRDFFSRLLQQDELVKEMLVAAFTFLLTLNNRHIKLDPQAVQGHCVRLGFSNLSSFQLESKLKLFRPTFVDECYYQFVNRYVYEGVALALGKHYLEHVIHTVDWKFFIQNCLLTTKKEKELCPFMVNHRLDIRRTSSHGTRSPAYLALLDRMVEGLQAPDRLVQACQHPNLPARQFADDMLDKFETDADKCAFLTGTTDVVHGMGFLYWSVWCRSHFLTKWILKSVHRLGGRFEKGQLVCVACACCVLRDKHETLEMLLHHWQKCTRESPTNLLKGKCTPRLTLPLPTEDLCYDRDWQAHLHEARCRVNGSHQSVSNSRLHSDATLVAGNRPPSSPPSSACKGREVLMSKSVSSNQGQCSEKEVKSVDISVPLLHLAVMCGNLQAVSVIIKKWANVLQVLDHEGRTALHIAAVVNDVDITRLLLLEGSPCLLSRHRDTPLHEACREGHAEVSKLLLQKWPCKVNECNLDGQTPAFLAVASGNLDLVELLIQHKAVLDGHDDKGDTLLHIACRRHDNVMMVMRLVEVMDVDVRNKHSLDCPLHVACCLGDSRIVQILIDAGADLDARNVTESTPLHCASESGWVDVVRTLVQAGADMFIADSSGRCPHHCATPQVQAYLAATVDEQHDR